MDTYAQFFDIRIHARCQCRFGSRILLNCERYSILNPRHLIKTCIKVFLAVGTLRCQIFWISCHSVLMDCWRTCTRWQRHRRCYNCNALSKIDCFNFATIAIKSSNHMRKMLSQPEPCCSNELNDKCKSISLSTQLGSNHGLLCCIYQK